MLQRGYHASFSEIFGLIKQQADARLRAGPDSSLWNQRPLTEEHDKLDIMKQYLMEAESAALTGISVNNNNVSAFHYCNSLFDSITVNNNNVSTFHYCNSLFDSISVNNNNVSAFHYCNSLFDRYLVLMITKYPRFITATHSF